MSLLRFSTLFTLSVISERQGSPGSVVGMVHIEIDMIVKSEKSAIDPPLFEFWTFDGGGSVENPKLSGLCGGLLFITMFLLSDFQNV